MKQLSLALAGILFCLLAAACHALPDAPIPGTTEPPAPEETECKPDDAPKLPTRKQHGTLACNGLVYNSGVQYSLDLQGEMTITVEAWGETFRVPTDEVGPICGVETPAYRGCTVFSVSVLEDTGVLLLAKDTSPAPVFLLYRFTRGHASEMSPALRFEVNGSPRFAYCNFIDGLTGYLFLFDEVSSLHMLWKTTDGGRVWLPQPIETPRDGMLHCRPTCVKMIDEQVGFLCLYAWASPELESECLLTFDGGRTWERGLRLPGEPVGWAYDLQVRDGQYQLFVWEEYEKRNLVYTSSDLKHWTKAPNAEEGS